MRCIVCCDLLFVSGSLFFLRRKPSYGNVRKCCLLFAFKYKLLLIKVCFTSQVWTLGNWGCMVVHRYCWIVFDIILLHCFTLCGFYCLIYGQLEVFSLHEWHLPIVTDIFTLFSNVVIIFILNFIMLIFDEQLYFKSPLLLCKFISLLGIER